MLKAFSAQALIFELAHTIELLPLTKSLRAEIGLPFLPLTDCGEIELPIGPRDVFARASSGGKLAYVEAEIFGGVGAQAHVLFQDGVKVSEANVGQGVINDALRFIGVVANPGFDEFDTVGLGKHRNTEDWVPR